MQVCSRIHHAVLILGVGLLDHADLWMRCRLRLYADCRLQSGFAVKPLIVAVHACRGGAFIFDFNISTGYPHDAPKVKCLTKVMPLAAAVLQTSPAVQSTDCSARQVCVWLASCGDACINAKRVRTCFLMCQQVYHPNIDLEGNICLNILREDWKPVLSINSVIYGLNFLFIVRPCCRRLLCVLPSFNQRWSAHGCIYVSMSSTESPALAALCSTSLRCWHATLVPAGDAHTKVPEVVFPLDKHPMLRRIRTRTTR